MLVSTEVTVLMTENAMTDDFMTITEAARRAYVSDAQVRYLLKHGRLTRDWLVSLGELRTVLMSGNGRDGR